MPLRYLALGDSYTIGTGASDSSRSFPSLLAGRLVQATGKGVELENPAVHGYTTLDLIREELPHAALFRADLVTILIGVNDLVEGVEAEIYGRRLGKIYGAIGALQPGAGRVAVISIPDFAAAPAALRFGAPGQLRARTAVFNKVAQEEADRHGFSYIDIGEVSRSGLGRPGWFAADDLHPGDAQYAAWADYLWQILRDDWSAVKPQPSR